MPWPDYRQWGSYFGTENGFFFSSKITSAHVPDSSQWRKTDSAVKTRILARLRRLWKPLAALASGLTGLAVYLYESHIQICPVTGRRKFLCLTADQMEKVADTGVRQLMHQHEGKFLAGFVDQNKKIRFIYIFWKTLFRLGMTHARSGWLECLTPSYPRRRHPRRTS